ncbi:hypothetical protein D3C86_1750890 [compost metagenome]
MALPAVQAATPALMFRQAQRRQPFLWGVTVGMCGAGRQFGHIPTRQVEQRIIDFSLRRHDKLTIVAKILPPEIKGVAAFLGSTVLFIRHNDVC